MAGRRRSKKKRESPISLTPAQQAQGAGCILLALALLTVLTLFSVSRGPITEGWVSLLRQAFGWGTWLTPLGLGALGIWLLRRYAGEEPEERWEKPLGMLLLFAVILTLMHLFLAADDLAAAAAAGQGGGYVGLVLSDLFVAAVGWAGAVVVTLALLGISLILVSSLSLGEMFGLLRRGWDFVHDWYLLNVRPIRVNKPAPPPAASLPTGKEEGLGKQILDRVLPPADKSPAEKPSPATEGRPSLASSLFPRIIGSQEWRLPAIEEIFEESSEQEVSQHEIRQRAKIIEETLHSFGVPAKVVEVNQGPAVTQFGLEPGYVERRDAEGRIKRSKVKVSRISALAKDLALALSASPIRIEAPVPGRPIVGVEVPNAQTNLVALRGIVESEAFREIESKLKIALGQDVAGQPVVADLATMPHLLIAGATGSGKSVSINSIISCLLCNNTPDDLRLLLIDPKMVELTNYNGIPHLLAPVVTDLERVVGVLLWATREMDRRYRVFAKAGARNLENYNEMQRAKGGKTLPYIVIVVDELADVMMMSPDEVERHVCRIAQMARATGLHMVIATQRPSVDVVTGLIKANFPARISFAVTSQVDSRVILDSVGAESLLGRGDMLYMAADSSKLVRLQGCFVSDSELTRLVRYWKGIRTPAVEGEGQQVAQAGEVPGPSELDAPLQQQALWSEFIARAQQAEEEDPLLRKAIDEVQASGRASVSLLQRRLRIGYSRAARLIDTLEERGIIGPDEGGGRSRQVLLPGKGEEEEPGGASF
jgi:S-DNA-T family DNA segregation ATPase FtsK/SpoIIIE